MSIQTEINRIKNEVDEQEVLIDQIATVLEGKASGGDVNYMMTLTDGSVVNMDNTELKKLIVLEGEVVKITDTNNNLIWEKIITLPSAYQEVEWIATDGNSWFVSDFTINDLDKFTLHYKYSVPSGDTYMFGANGIVQDNSRFLHRYQALVINQSTAGNAQAFNFVHDNTFQSYEINFVHASKVVAYNGETKVYEGAFYNFKSYANFGVFCNNYNGQMSTYKAKSGSKIAELRFVDDTTGQDVFNLIPCYRKSDNVIGMYDLVADKFYTNEGTGSFIKGSDV